MGPCGQRTPRLGAAPSALSHRPPRRITQWARSHDNVANRLRRAGGQLAGVLRMYEAGRRDIDILDQLAPPVPRWTPWPCSSWAITWPPALLLTSRPTNSRATACTPSPPPPPGHPRPRSTDSPTSRAPDCTALGGKSLAGDRD
ncbi:metal-sensitive transcriptional regulator [Sphaerimonospora thailandensis]|nr:metal-sensing transcriptional repressor [Sphaerimonospora thailandensis]